MKRMLLVLTVLVMGCTLKAQLLTWNPPFPKEADPNQSLVITMDASKGNAGLLNHTPTDSVYVHIGVITNKSNGGWVNVPFTWGTAPAAGRATYIGNNKWTYTINGSLRSFFNVNASDTIIQKVAILFRSANGAKKQANSDGSDMYIPVYTNALAVRIDNPPSEPRFVRVAEPTNWQVGGNYTVTANSNNTASLKLYLNGVQIGAAPSATTVSGSASITAAGNQQLVAEANDGSAVRYDTVNIFVAPSGGSPVAALPAGVRDGINYEPGDTSVILVLRAPGKSVVTVIGEFNNWTPTAQHILNKTPDGKFFWIRLRGLTPGREYAYQYVVDNNLKIADPYTEKVLDPFNDQFITAATYPNLKPYPAGQTGNVSVFQTAMPSYNWAVNNFVRPDKRGLVIYELLVRDFVAAHDWKTMQDSLGYLKKLGVNAIEIMPFNEFEGNISWGYNSSFYFAPDKYYGTKNAFKQFVDSCHSKGIAVIMDIALNHQFGQSPMVQLYWDAANNRPAANSPWFNPAAKHPFNVGYDMNHESEDTRYFTSRVIEFWLKEYKLDGFRFDLSKGFTQVQSCDANGNNCNQGTWDAYDLSRINIWKKYYDTVQAKSANAYAILEHLSGNQEEKELADYGMLFWGHMNYPYSQAVKANPNGWDLANALHTNRGWTKPHLVAYMESHDEERLMYRALMEGSASASHNTRDTTTALKRMEQAAAFFFTIPGPKMIWQFGELGYPYSINHCTNGTVNNNCRLDPKPIRWDYLADPRRRAVYNTYSSLINLRFHPWYRQAFLTGTTDMNTSGAVKVIKVSSGDSAHIVVVGNFDVNVQTGTVTFQTPGTFFDYFNNTTFSATASAQNITLQPGEYRVYLNRNVNNIPTTAITPVAPAAGSLAASVYPNPSRGAFTVKVDLPQSGLMTMDLYTTTGQLVGNVYRQFNTSGVKQINIARPGVQAGTYFLRITGKSATTTIPVTIQ